MKNRVFDKYIIQQPISTGTHILEDKTQDEIWGELYVLREQDRLDRQPFPPKSDIEKNWDKWIERVTQLEIHKRNDLKSGLDAIMAARFQAMDSHLNDLQQVPPHHKVSVFIKRILRSDIRLPRFFIEPTDEELADAGIGAMPPPPGVGKDDEDVREKAEKAYDWMKRERRQQIGILTQANTQAAGEDFPSAWQMFLHWHSTEVNSRRHG